jgi:uncharacterized protein (TIGR03437 family)
VSESQTFTGKNRHHFLKMRYTLRKREVRMFRRAATAAGLAVCWLLPIALDGQIQPSAIGSVAGNGNYGFSGDNGPATKAQLDLAYAVAVDISGTVYIADTLNHRVRKVGRDGNIVTVAGNGQEGFSGDNGPGTSASLAFPRGLATDLNGNLFIADSANFRVRRLAPDGTITTYAGNGDDGFAGDGGAATLAQIRMPRGLATDSAGNLYIADAWNYRVRKVDRTGLIYTIAGTGENGYSGDGGSATSADLGFVQALAVDDAGNVYVSDVLNAVVRVITNDGKIQTVAGNGQGGYGGDGGKGTSAQLQYPRGLALDPFGNLYIADSANQRIRELATSGTITTVVGTGQAGFAGDTQAASSAQLNFPYGLAADPRGNLYTADLLNYRVREARLETVTSAPSVTSNSIVNAASFQPPVAPGSLISIFGGSFAAKGSSAGSLPLPGSLGGTTVSINGAPAPLLYVGPGQINAQLSASAPAGSASLKVSFGGVDSPVVSFTVAPTAPGIFLWGGANAVITNADGSLNTPANPATRGSTVTIWATGSGRVSPQPADGAAAGSNPLSTTSIEPTVTFGTIPATAAFSGLTPGLVGLWQINVAIPPQAPAGDTVAVQVQLSGGTSNRVTMAIR